MGGRLLRRVVGFLRDHEVELPYTSHILCASSGGADSTAAALLLARYGRRIVPAASISLLHVNHGWRGAESDADAEFVRTFGAGLGVPVIVHRLAETPGPGDSWEAHARALRKRIFGEEAARRAPALVLTAHTADDLAETKLWRLFSGAPASLGEGIRFRHAAEIRPFLGIRRAEFRAFLEEEKQPWREDATNTDPRFLRARMRRELLPAIEALFPRAIEAINRAEPIGAPPPGKGARPDEALNGAGAPDTVETSRTS